MNSDEQSHYGFKKLTTGNWKQGDMLDSVFRMPEQMWVEATLKPQLTQKVPEEVRALFEVARALFTYSWFFYPMATSGAEQMHRVLEAGARERCRQLGLPLEIPNAKGKSRPTNFATNIHQLTNAGAIDASDAIRWEATRSLRNWASHPQTQQILPPGMTLASLITNAEMLNRLFQ